MAKELFIQEILQLLRISPCLNHQGSGPFSPAPSKPVFFPLLDLQYLPEDILFHKNLDAYDNVNYDIIQHLQQSIQFIDKARQVTNIYVHCFAGVSRSVCCVTAYLMKIYKWSYSLAISFVKYKRQIANPNKGFTQQMMKYEYYLRENRNNKEQKKYRKYLRLIRPYDLPGYLK